MKNANGQAIADVLDKVAQAIRRLDESKIETLLAGNFRIELIVGSRDNRRNKNVRHQDTDTQKGIPEVAGLLRNIDDREQGRFILDQRVSSKDSLTRLARYLDLPLQKRETVERLKEKIIESTIGYRLRSRAIRGTDHLEKIAN